MTLAPIPTCPREGAVSWNINTSCNYRCSYCTQRFKDDRTRWSKDTPLFLEAFSRLRGAWEVKISGGEPFVHPTLLEIVSGLAEQGRAVSVVTNFSATKERLESYVEASRGMTRVFSCSLHPEYVPSPDAFAEKALWLSSLLTSARNPAAPPPHLCVTAVATRSLLPLMGTLQAIFKSAGLTFKVQPEKQDRRVAVYSAEEEAMLLSFGGHNLTGKVVHNFGGLPCWAGARYFILDDKGEAYRCYPARAKRLESLGNFLSPQFRLAEEPRACLYEACYCTVPISRGMMARRESLGGGE